MSDFAQCCHSFIPHTSFQKVCKDVKSMYHTLFLLFIVLAVGLFMSLVSVCTQCGRGSAPVITPLLMLGTFVACVLAFVVGGFSISFLSTPYNKLLSAFANDFSEIKKYTWAVFLPCYLGIAHMIWAQFQLIPNFMAYKSSKAFVDFKNGDYTAMGTNPTATANYGAANN